MLRRLFLLLAALLLPQSAIPEGGGQAEPIPLVMVAELRGAVSPASATYFLRALGEAQQARAALLVFRLDTPGGLDTSMREMIQAILASPVPVAMYVAPGGARAASAGTYLLYASHIAAMAPGTNLGAATPVQIGLGGERSKPAAGDKRDKDGKDGDGKGGQGNGKGGAGEQSKSGAGSGARDSLADPMSAKVTQDAAAYLRSLAQLRGRNAEWAEQAVRQAASLSAEEALKQQVVDVLAADLADLLRQSHGRQVKVGNESRPLVLAGARTVNIERNWQERVLARIADPNVALILMMLGIYGLLFEFYSPGMAAPGVIGGICLLLGLYGLALLPLNYAGVALLLLGLALMVAEAFLPSFGIVGIGGVVAFVAGALMLVDADVPGLTVSWALVLPLAMVSALVLAGIGGFALRARTRPQRAGREAMIGATAVAIDTFAGNPPEGWVRACGEQWRARSATPLAPGSPARIVKVEGLTLFVEPEGPPAVKQENKGERS